MNEEYSQDALRGIPNVCFTAFSIQCTSGDELPVVDFIEVIGISITENILK